MKSDAFFTLHRVFTFEEFRLNLSNDQESFSKNTTVNNLLAYHVREGHILRIRRGLYYSIPKDMDPAHCPIDPFLVASKMAEDAVISYGSALDLHGKLHTVRNRIVYVTKKQTATPFDFRDVTYQAVAIPSELKRSGQEIFGIQPIDRLGERVLVTSLERALVDVLDRPYLCGSWEEIWLSAESIEYFDVDQIVKYALLLANSTTIAKVGFFLETHRKALMIPEHYLQELQKHAPVEPHYLEQTRNGPQKMIPKWNLIVPLSLINRSWEERHADI